MKFGLIFESLLLEMSGDDIFSKYYANSMSRNVFNNIVTSDPRTKVNNKEIVKVGKYSKLLLSMYLNGNLKLEDLPNAKEYLGYVYKYGIPLNVNEIRTLPDIFNKIEKYRVYETKDLGDILGSLNEKEYDIKMNGNQWLIVVPLSERASCYLGVNAEWCTTWGPNSMNPSHRGRENRFNAYNKQGPLYIIINKDNQNEKYQFHFPNKEYMNYRNSRFDEEYLLNNNPEIKSYFFPSLFGKPSNFDQEMKYIDILGDKDVTKLFEININSDDNLLVKSLLNGDEKTIKTLISDEEYISGTYDIELKKNINKLLINIKGNLYGLLSELNNVISIYRRQVDNSYEQIRYDLEDMNDVWKKDAESFFIDFFETNKLDIKSQIGISDFNQFKKIFYDDFLNDEGLQETWFDKFIDKTHPNLENANNVKLKEYTSKIDIGDSYREIPIELSIPYFSKFLIENNITKIENNLIDVLENYVESHFGSWIEFEDVEYDLDYPTYKDLESKFNDFFDNLFEVFDSGVSSGECLRQINLLEKIKNDYFNGGNKFENNDVYFELKSNSIDCKNAMILVSYVNKKTNQKFEGRVKIDNIINYIQNKQLFENIIRVKRVL